MADSILKCLNHHSRAGGNPERKVEETVLPDKFLCGQVWIPACAGMTAKMFFIGNLL